VLSFVIFDIRELLCSALSVRVPGQIKFGLAEDAFLLYWYGNSGRQRVKLPHLDTLWLPKTSRQAVTMLWDQSGRQREA